MAKADSSINARTAPDQVLLDIADYVLDYKVADERSFDTARLCVTDSLACAFEALTKAYEIQGCIAIENDFFHQGSDHNLLVRVVTTAVLTRLLGGTRAQIISAVSSAWINTSLVAYRYAPNTGSRKNWACGDASFEAVRLAIMALKGEQGVIR